MQPKRKVSDVSGAVRRRRKGRSFNAGKIELATTPQTAVILRDDQLRQVAGILGYQSARAAPRERLIEWLLSEGKSIRDKLNESRFKEAETPVG